MEKLFVGSFDSAFDLLWGAPGLSAKFRKIQIESVVASMTMGIDFWNTWHESRGQRAIQSVEHSSFGNHKVIRANFR
jgi:hypothetical protein